MTKNTDIVRARLKLDSTSTTSSCNGPPNESYNIISSIIIKGIAVLNTICIFINILDVSVTSHKPLLVTIPTEFKHFVDDTETVNRNITLHNIDDVTIKTFSQDFDTPISSTNIRTDCVYGLASDGNAVKNIFSNFYSNQVME